MITVENLKEVVTGMDDFDRKRVMQSDKKYCILYLNTFNAGHATAIALTDDENRYKNVEAYGNARLLLEEVQRILIEDGETDPRADQEDID